MKTVLRYIARPAKMKHKRTTKSPKNIICNDAKHSMSNRNTGLTIYHVTKKLMLN